MYRTIKVGWLALLLLLAQSPTSTAFVNFPPDTKLVLKNRVQGALHGVICAVEPQTLTVFEFDGTYYYASSPDDRSHDPDGGPWDNLPCGIRFSTRTPGDVGVILDARGEKDVGNEEIFFFEPLGPAPIVEVIQE